MNIHNQRKKLIFPLILLILATTTVFIFSSSTSSLADGDQTRTYTSRWKITDWNESSLLYWYPKAYVNATIGSFVNFTVTLPEGQPVVQSDINGTIEIGNFTDTVPNSEVASALTLSIWPWLPGLVTFPDWKNHTAEAREAVNGEFMKGTLTIENITYSDALEGTSRDAIKFNYQQDSGFQATTVIYDRETGVLLYASTKAGNFKMELLLVHSDFIPEQNTSPETTPNQANTTTTPSLTIMVFVIAIGTSIALSLKKKRS